VSSTVEICNGALQYLGEIRIVALTQTTKEARECNSAWDRVRRATIRRHSWNSTTARASLPKLSTVPAYGFDIEYQLPADCLRVFDIEGSDNETDWRVEGRKLLTDFGAPLGILYAQDITDSQQFDPMLVEVLALALAVSICETITQSNTKKKELMANLKDAITDAKIVDGQEQTPSEFEEDNWLLVRWRR